MIHLRSSSACLLYGQGHELQSEAEPFWEQLAQRQRDFCLWDWPPAERERVFAGTIANAPLVGFARIRDRYIACAWCLPIAPGSETVSIHFTVAMPDPDLWQLSLEFVAHAQKLFPTIVANIPEPLRGARSFAASLGFQEKAVLVRACWLKKQTRLVNARLMIRQRTQA